MLRLVVIGVLSLATAAQAADCTIENARYEQGASDWVLTFRPVPQASAANQTAAFTIDLPASKLALDGAVHRPNGFGSPLWSIAGPCSVAKSDTCTFVEGDGTAIYGNGADGVAWFDDSPGAAAPRQVILPRLAASMWYSMYRDTAFGDGDPGDVFTLVGCD